MFAFVDACKNILGISFVSVFTEIIHGETVHNSITMHKISRFILLSCNKIRPPAGAAADRHLYLIKDEPICLSGLCMLIG